MATKPVVPFQQVVGIARSRGQVLFQSVIEMHRYYLTQALHIHISPLIFAPHLGVSQDSLSSPIYVSTPVGDSLVVDCVHWSCLIALSGFETRANLLLLGMVDLDVILGMNWLSPHYANLDCHAKTVTLAMPHLPRLEWRGTLEYTLRRVISFLKAQRMVEKRCDTYLAYVRDVSIDTPTVESVPLVRDNPDVFPADLSGMPPNRDIDFCIDLLPGTHPISIPLYRMA
ncbi:uncharacterized protein [Nicotiana tomentosiformis]|uniref:uncharacterized protein n=1 Tax=Nicotiana tomentosiformis TaxID=4098 RepID=UPI00388CE08E